MKWYHKFLSIMICLIIFGTISFFLWKRGTPYETVFWSPNKQYYVQKYSNITLSSIIPVMPGSGSDMNDGYIRVFDKDGNCINERFVYFLRDVKPIWGGNKVYLMGVAEMDDDPWILPTTAN